MEHTKDHITFTEKKPGGNGDNHPPGKDPSPLAEKMPKTPVVRPGIAQGHGDPSNQKEEPRSGLLEIKPEPGIHNERVFTKKHQVEQEMKGDHHHHRQATEEVDLPVPL